MHDIERQRNLNNVRMTLDMLKTALLLGTVTPKVYAEQSARLQDAEDALKRGDMAALHKVVSAFKMARRPRDEKGRFVRLKDGNNGKTGRNGG